MLNPRGLSPSKLLAMVIDGFGLAIVFFIALTISTHAYDWSSISNMLAIRVSVMNFILFLIFLLAGVLLLKLSGFYRLQSLFQPGRRAVRSGIVIALMVTLLALVRGVLDLSFANELFFGAFAVLAFVTLMLSREVAKEMRNFFWDDRWNVRNVVVVGEGSSAHDLADAIRSQDDARYRILSILDVEALHEVDGF